MVTRYDFIHRLVIKAKTTPCSTINNTTGKNCSPFERSHFRILSTDSKSRTILYSIIKNTYGKYCSIVFTRMGGTLQGFVYRLGTIRIYVSLVFI